MKKLVLIIITLLGSLSLSAELHIITQKDKYGFADENGNIVIKPQYKQVTPFVNGRAKVQKGDKWGYIDEQGKQVIKIQYDLLNDFNENGIALIKKGKKWGYLKSDGTYMIEPKWTFIGTPNEQGYVWVSKAKSLDMGGIGLYKHDQQIIKPGYRYIGFYQKTDSVDYSDGHVFTTDEAKEITGNLSKLSVSDIPYIWCDYGYRRGVLDLNGKTIVKCVSYAQGAPSNEMVTVRKYDKKKQTYSYNYIPADGSNKKILKNDLKLGVVEPELCHPFREGSALIVTNNDGCYLIDKTGNVLTSKYDTAFPISDYRFIIGHNNKYGILDYTGREIVNCKYQNILKPIQGSKLLGAQNATTSKYGIIDFNGKTVVPFEYEGAAGALHDKVYVKIENAWGIVDMKQNTVVTPRWADMKYALNSNDKLLWVKDSGDNKWHTLDIEKDKIVYDFSFDDAVSFNEDGVAFVNNNEKYGAVTSSGKCIIPLMLSRAEILQPAINYLKSCNKESMNEIEAYRFNIYHSTLLNTYRLHQTIEEEMWDY